MVWGRCDPFRSIEGDKRCAVRVTRPGRIIFSGGKQYACSVVVTGEMGVCNEGRGVPAVRSKQ